ncbi:tyrosine-type recombinase/integrase [Membranihabitans maritimus]|uniref:tyrosine-type recombinase/integrase n=1 Tax=Membranihabitans maritimus TaxID=2904244 RepID=UPI001F2577FE|nr:site-specific integrase [Membranihabitans maritimus]
MSVKLRWKTYPNGTKSAYLDIYDKGQRRRKSIDVKIKKGDKNKREKKRMAEAIRTKHHEDLLNNKWNLVDDDKLSTSFLKYFQYFLDSYQRVGKRKYEATHKQFKEFIKVDGGINHNLTFQELTPQVCERFRDYLFLQAGLSGETPYDYFSRFKAVINKAIREKFLLDNPLVDVKIKKPGNDLKKQILTAEEIQKLANTYCGNSDVKKAFIFACFTGIGEKEARNLKWKDLADGMLNIRRAKNEQKVTSKLPATAIKVLGEYGKPDENVFTLPSNTAIRKNIKNWKDKAGIKKHITFYCARHSFAIMNLKNGANLLTISKLMGHTDTSHTVKYLNYIDEEKNKAMDSMPDINIT